jgi:nucleoside diphosphate kinase
MKKVIKKIKKIMADIDKVEAKEETLREDLSEAIDELEDSDDAIL